MIAQQTETFYICVYVPCGYRKNIVMSRHGSSNRPNATIAGAAYHSSRTNRGEGRASIQYPGSVSHNSNDIIIDDNAMDEHSRGGEDAQPYDKKNINDKDDG